MKYRVTLSAGALVWGCAVYDTELLPSDAGVSGAGSSGADGGRGGMVSGGASSSGGTKPTSSSGSGSTQAGTSAGGTDPSEGGAPNNEEGGMGGDDPAGSGGSAGSAGAGGQGGSAGSSGSGGGGNVVKCSDHPLTLKTTWKALASSSSLGDGTEADGLYNPPEHAIDGLNGERWSTGITQLGDEWFEVDFGAEVTFDRVTLQLFGNTNDYPRAWAVRVSNASMNFNAPALISGAGAAGHTIINLAAPETGQFLLIRQTGVNDTGTEWWSISELLVACTAN